MDCLDHPIKQNYNTKKYYPKRMFLQVTDFAKQTKTKSLFQNNGITPKLSPMSLT